jgi:hypothetical protein
MERVKRGPTRQKYNNAAAGRREMRNFLDFLVWRMITSGSSIWGIVDIVELPDGGYIIVRDIWMGDSFETEFDLRNGTIVRIRDGRVRVFRDILDE